MLSIYDGKKEKKKKEGKTLKVIPFATILAAETVKVALAATLRLSLLSCNIN